jgi:hypothetical protein
VWLDAKQSPYVLENSKQKLEFAKDVSALANAAGGVILLGFDTERHATTSGEHISKICPFPLTMANPDRYAKVLASSVHPPSRRTRSPPGGRKGPHRSAGRKSTFQDSLGGG